MGATLMFIGGLVAIALTFGLGPRDREGIAVFFFWVALMMLIGVSGYVKRLFTKIFSEEEPSSSKKIASPRGAVLPANYSAPIADSGRQFVDTSKMGQPSSITEQTTSRLNKV